MKLSNVALVHKMDLQSEKDNYCPVNISCNLSKVFDRYIYSQISEYSENILSKYQCGFKKEHDTHDCWGNGAMTSIKFGILFTTDYFMI